MVAILAVLATWEVLAGRWKRSRSAWELGQCSKGLCPINPHIHTQIPNQTPSRTKPRIFIQTWLYSRDSGIIVTETLKLTLSVTSYEQRQEKSP